MYSYEAVASGRRKMTRVTRDKHRLRVAQRRRLKLEASSPCDYLTNTDEDDSPCVTTEASGSSTVKGISHITRACCWHHKRAEKERAQQRIDKQREQDTTAMSRTSSDDYCSDTSMSPQPARPAAMPRPASMQSILLNLKEEFHDNARLFDSEISDIDTRRELS